MNRDEHPDTAVVYEIRLQGHLPPRWCGWFAGFAIALTPQGDTVLTGPLADQAALFGVLKKVRDLGLPLLALNRVMGDGRSTQMKEQDR